MQNEQPQHSESHIELDTKAVKPFLRAMALVGKRLKDKEDAQKDLDSHIEQMKKGAVTKKKMDSHVSALKDHIANLVKAEKKLAGYKESPKKEEIALNERIIALESQLGEERQKSMLEKARYQKQINEMKATFSQIKTKMLEMIDEKRKREERMALLSQRIRKGAGARMPSNFS